MNQMRLRTFLLAAGFTLYGVLCGFLVARATDQRESTPKPAETQQKDAQPVLVTQHDVPLVTDGIHWLCDIHRDHDKVVLIKCRLEKDDGPTTTVNG